MLAGATPNLNQSRIRCPQCHHAISPEARICPHCTVHVGMAAVEESNRISETLFAQPTFAAPESLFPRLGDYLVGKGVVTHQELDEALRYQKALGGPNKQKLLGQILVEQGIITRSQLDTAVTEQIVELKTALEQSNRQLEHRVAQRTVELEKAVARLGELDKMKANFVASVSHELRTPLSQIVGYLDLMSLDGFGPLNPDQEGAVHAMTGASRRLWTLIEDLLQFSDAAAGKLVLEQRPFPIAEPVDVAFFHKSPAAKARQVNLVTDITPNLPFVHGDLDKITWVVSQFLDNAIKFTPPNGRVIAQAHQKADRIQIDVIDTGIGIPEARLDELTLSFHQLEDSNTRHHEGLGLGLAMAHQILQAHGSTIHVQSQVGVGSHFAFSLPCHN